MAALRLKRYELRLARAVLVVVGVPENDVADAFESEGAEAMQGDAGQGAKLQASGFGEDDLVGRSGGFGAGGGVDVGAVPGVFEELGRPAMDANAELYGAGFGHDRLGPEPHLNLGGAEQGGAGFFKGEEEGVADGHDFFSGVIGDTVADEAEMTCLDGAEVSLVSSAGVLTKRCGALGRAGAGHVGEDEGEGCGGFEAIGRMHGFLGGAYDVDPAWDNRKKYDEKDYWRADSSFLASRRGLKVESAFFQTSRRRW